MQLRNCFLIFIAVIISSCTSEPNTSQYSITVNNQSSNEITIVGYNAPNEIVYQATIQPSNSSGNCTEFLEFFLGLGTCGADSLVFRFPNNKGYICALRQNGTQFCFGNKDPFDRASFTDLGNNNFEFVIAQQDFENAFDLP